jgi:hypothetical protein
VMVPAAAALVASVMVLRFVGSSGPPRAWHRCVRLSMVGVRLSGMEGWVPPITRVGATALHHEHAL